MAPDPECVALVVQALQADAKSINDARRRPAEGGVPDDSGFYAWWAEVGMLPDADGVPHPSDPTLRAFYVGISPARRGTRQRLRGRVVGNHIGGNTGGSTFRLALAALLLDARGYRPCRRLDAKGREKYVLPREQNQDLRKWQQQHLRVTWATCDQPWREGFETAVIAHFRPPLNSANNADHPFHHTLTDARARFRAVARGCD